jgi:hypothetical protein
VALGVLLALWLAGCAADVNEVALILPEDGAVGLTCVDSETGEPLLTRARVTGGTVEVSVVVDYLRFEGVPSCRPTQLLAWCAERGCPAVARDCRTVRLPVPGGTPTLPEIQDAVLTELARGGPVTSDAPDGVVLVRMVVTNQACDALLPSPGERPPRPACDDLLGCLYSCPVQLDEVRGDVLLELDSLTEQCDEVVVGVCAGIGHGGRPFCAE